MRIRGCLSALALAFLVLVTYSREGLAAPTHFGEPLVPATSAPAAAATPSPAPAAPAAKPRQTCSYRGHEYEPGINVVCLDRASSVIVLPSEAPPSRTRLSFDSPGGDHIEVEWNPTDGMALSRSVFLAQGPWQVSFHATPLPHPTEPTTDFAWKFSLPDRFHWTAPGSDSLDLGYVVATLPVKKDADRQVFITLREEPKPKLEDIVAPLGELGGSAQAAAFGARSKDIASEVVGDALEVLAQIAMDRAQSRALELVKDRVIGNLCVPQADFNIAACKALGRDSCTAATNQFVLLAKSCEAVRGMRLRELANAGPGMERAVIEDLSVFGIQAITQRIFFLQHDLANDHISGDMKLLQRQLEPLLAQVARTISTAMTTRANPNPAEIQGILHALARMIQQQQFETADFNDQDVQMMRYGLSVAVATLSLCQQSGRCNGRFIEEVLESPQDYFDLKNSLGTLGSTFDTLATRIKDRKYMADSDRERFLKVLPRLEKFVTQGLEVLEPPKDASPRDTARNALLLIIDAADLLSIRFPKTSDAKQWALVQSRLKVARDFVNGALGREAQPLLLTSLQVLRTFAENASADMSDSPSFKKGARVLGALVSYAATYEHPSSSGTERQQIQARRKETLEALIDIATDRHDRDGDQIYSLGVNVGFTAIGMRRLTNDSPHLQWAQLGLPFGIARQSFSNSGCPGLHLQLSVLDLGQYVAFSSGGGATPPRWQTALTANLQAGALLGTPKDPFVIGVDLRYSPALFPTDGNQNGGALSYGLFVGYYVPFFDLN